MKNLKRLTKSSKI